MSKVVVRLSQNLFLETLAVLRDPPIDPLAPSAKTRWLEISPHYLDHLRFGKASAFLDIFKSCPVLPGKTNDLIDLRIIYLHVGSYVSEDPPGSRMPGKHQFHFTAASRVATITTNPPRSA